MKKVRLGIIGVGNMGMQVAKHIVLGKECPEIELSAICDMYDSRIETAKEMFRDEGINYFSDPEEMMKSGVCDAVYIAVPHYDHPTLATKAFGYGLHVMLEKPAGVDTRSVRKMNEEAKKSGLKFGMMFQNRNAPVYKKVKNILDSGEFGEIRGVTWIVTNWYRSQAYYDSGSWRATWAGEGGGVLLNQCPHNLDLIQWLCGMPESIYAKCSVGQWHDIEVEDDVSAIFKYKNGALGTFITSTGMNPGTNRLEIATDKGTIILENASKLMVNELDRSLPEAANEMLGSPDSPKITTVAYTFPELKAEKHSITLNAFAGAILRNEKLIIDGEEGIKSLTLSNAMYLSDWTNSEISLPLNEELFLEELEKRKKISKHKDVKAVFVDAASLYQKK